MDETVYLSLARSLLAQWRVSHLAARLNVIDVKLSAENATALSPPGHENLPEEIQPLAAPSVFRMVEASRLCSMGIPIAMKLVYHAKAEAKVVGGGSWNLARPRSHVPDRQSKSTALIATGSLVQHKEYRKRSLAPHTAASM